MKQFLIVGLGNPGLQYEQNRHNVGFLAIDQICKKFNIFLNTTKFEGTFNHFDVNENRFYIAKPYTFMNNSGFFVSSFINYFKIEKSNVLVIYDDIDTNVGKIKIKIKGSSGGQNGMKSIINQLGTQDIARIKVGIGKPKHDLVHHVLSNFSSQEKEDINVALNMVVNAIEDFVKHLNINNLMNKFN